MLLFDFDEAHINEFAAAERMAYIRPPTMDERLEKDYLAAAHWATLREKARRQPARNHLAAGTQRPLS